MATDPPPLNPYQPTTEVAASEARPEPDREEPVSLGRVAARWFTICGVSALPSFFFGFSFTGGRISGMLLGIFIFAVGYTLIDYRTAKWPIRRKKMIRRTLKITYGTRIAISIIFPVGMYLDLICGMLSIGIVSEIFGESFGPLGGRSGDHMSFVGSLATTLVQGCVLNVVLAVYGLLVLAVHAVVSAVKK